jgi:mutator protein MutT
MKLYFSQKAFIVNEGKLLAIQKNANAKEMAFKWEVPGGRIEPGEDLDAALQREVHEETGLKITPGEHFAIWDWKRKHGDHAFHVVASGRISTFVSGIVTNKNNVEGDNIEQIKWIPLKDVRALDWPQEMEAVIEKFLKRQGL